MAGRDAVHVLIASPLEAEHADRIAAADRRVRLLYEPELLPVPRYPCDHDGVKRELGAAGLERWAGLRARRRQLRLRLAGTGRDPGELAQPALDPGHQRRHRRPARAHRAAAENRLLTDLFVDNLGRLLAGEPLRNTFDPAAGY